MNKQLSTNTTQKTKDRATPLTTDGELRCSERLCNSCPTCDIRDIFH